MFKTMHSYRLFVFSLTMAVLCCGQFAIAMDNGGRTVPPAQIFEKILGHILDGMDIDDLLEDESDNGGALKRLLRLNKETADTLINMLYKRFKKDYDYSKPFIATMLADDYPALLWLKDYIEDRNDGNDRKVLKKELNTLKDEKLQADLGDTPLMLAAQFDNIAAVRLLLSRGGADVDMENGNGDTAFILASSGGGTPNMLGLLLKHGADINHANNNGNEALHVAARRGYIDKVRYLLDKGANIEAVGENGYRALHLAILEGHNNSGAEEVIEELVSRKADVNAKTDFKHTPLLVAVLNEDKEDDKLKILNILKKRPELEVCEGDSRKKGPIFHAKQQKLHKVATWLKEQGKNSND